MTLLPIASGSAFSPLPSAVETGASASALEDRVSSAAGRALDTSATTSITPIATTPKSPDRTPMKFALLSRWLLELGYLTSPLNNDPLKVILVNLIQKITKYSSETIKEEAEALVKEIQAAASDDNTALAQKVRDLLKKKENFHWKASDGRHENSLEASLILAIQMLADLFPFWEEGLIAALKEHLSETDTIKQLAKTVKEADLPSKGTISLKDEIAHKLISHAASLDPDPKETMLQLAISIMQEESSISIDLGKLSAENKTLCEQLLAMYKLARSLKSKENVLGPSIPVTLLFEIAGIDPSSDTPALSNTEALTFLDTFTRTFNTLRRDLQVFKDLIESEKNRQLTDSVAEMMKLAQNSRGKQRYLLDEKRATGEAKKRFADFWEPADKFIQGFDSLCLQFDRLSKHMLNISTFCGNRDQNNVVFLQQVSHVLELIERAVATFIDVIDDTVHNMRLAVVCLSPKPSTPTHRKPSPDSSLSNEVLDSLNRFINILKPSDNKDTRENTITTFTDQIQSLLQSLHDTSSARLDITPLDTPFMREKPSSPPEYPGDDVAARVIQKFLTSTPLTKETASAALEVSITKWENIGAACKNFVAICHRIAYLIESEHKKAEKFLAEKVADYDRNFAYFDALVLGDDIDAAGNEEAVSASSLLYTQTQKVFAATGEDTLEAESRTDIVPAEKAPFTPTASITFVPTGPFTTASFLKHLLDVHAATSLPATISSRTLVKEARSHLVLAGIDLQVLIDALAGQDLAQAITATSMLMVDTHVALEQSLKACLQVKHPEERVDDHSLLSLAIKLEGALPAEKKAFFYGSDQGTVWARYSEAASARWRSSKQKPILVVCLETLKGLKDLKTPENQAKATQVFGQLKTHLLETARVIFTGIPEEELLPLDEHIRALTPSYSSTSLSSKELTAGKKTLMKSLEQIQGIIKKLLERTDLDIATKTSLQEVRNYLLWLKSAASIVDADTSNVSAYWIMRLFIGGIDKMFENVYIAACRFHGMGDIRSHNLTSLHEMLSSMVKSLLAPGDFAKVADFNVGNAFQYPHQRANPRSQILLNVLKHSLAHVGIEEGFTPVDLKGSIADWKDKLIKQTQAALTLWIQEAAHLFTVTGQEEAPPRAGAGI